MKNLTDPWSAQKVKLVHFYKEVFDKDISFEGMKMPEYTEEFPVLGYIDCAITGNMMVQTYKRLFGDNSVCGNYSADIDICTKHKQHRPQGNYCIAHVGGIEVDKKHLNKSYSDFHQDGNHYMIPVEGIIFALHYRFETGNMLNIKGVTRFHAHFIDFHVIRMGGCNSRFRLDWQESNYGSPGGGPRQIKLAI